MTKEEILGRLESLPFIEIFHVEETCAVVYNQQAETDFTVRFAEFFTKEDLKALIHICSGIPKELQFDSASMAEYLWQVMDHNAFLTLGGLWFVWEDADYSRIAKFHEYGDAVLLPEYKATGCMWFQRQVCIVDVGRILAQLEKKYPNYREDPDFDATGYLRRELVVTALHELRHLMLDTNPALPIDQYPLELGNEAMVERYAQELCEDNSIAHIFTN